jgi:hypothetical protein
MYQILTITAMPYFVVDALIVPLQPHLQVLSLHCNYKD